jgi:serine protease Do
VQIGSSRLYLIMDIESYNNPDSSTALNPAMQRRPNRLPFLLLILLGVIVLAALPMLMGEIEYSRTKKEVQALKESLPDLNLKSLSKAFTLVYKKVKPTVVHINTHRELKARRDAFGGLWDSRTQSFEQQGEASGFIVDPAGYLLTNLHVVEDATEVTVTLEDQRTFTADVVGVDPGLDLAVLKIDASGLTAITWGNSDNLDVGEMVWAIGNPFDLDQTVTSGIVSAKGRRDLGKNPLQEFLQTDVPINPGSSGGPLVDVDGDVVGINSAIVGRTYQGISFAIPGNAARAAYDKIRSKARMVRGYLGVGLATVTPVMAGQLKLPADRASGAVVVAVTGGSPAEKAGIEPGDVIVDFNGQPVNEDRELQLLIARSPVGSKVPVKLIRDGKMMTLDVEVVERPEQLR